MIIRNDMIDNVDADGVVLPGIEEKFPRGKKAVGVAELQNVERSLAHPGNLECPFIQFANFAIPASGAFRKDEEIASAIQITLHRFHVLHYQP